MKHLKKFNQLNEGALNEVYGKKTQWRYDEERFDPDLKELLGAVNSVIEESPITFDMDLKEDGFTVTGPFGISMRIELDKAKSPNSSSYNPSYSKVGVKAYIDKKVIKAEDPKDLWDKLQKSAEFKALLKGDKIEKLRTDRIKSIITAGRKADEIKRRELVLEYLYYVTPETISNKSDNSGPWATTATSIRTYKYDLSPLSKAWDAKVEKAKFDNKEAQNIYNDMLKGEGYYQGPLKPEVKLALEKSPLVDVDDLGDNEYDVYTYSPTMMWDNMMDELRTEVVEKLGYKSRYMVDEKVSQYGVKNDNGVITLIIKVETTVWQN